MSLSKRRRRELRKNGMLDDRETVPQKGMKLIDIEPKTFAQEQVFDAFDTGDHLLLHGMAGTGKTFVSMYLALEEIFNNKQTPYTNVTIIRSVVPTREIGYLPGKESDKIGVYEQPYRAICNQLFRRGDAYDILKQKNLVEFMSTSFIRGLTLDNTIVIVDEVNNMTFHELDSLITRIGDNCRLVFCGDFRQSDFHREHEKNGLPTFMKIVDRLSGFEHIEFTQNDIVRSRLVKEYIIAREEFGVCV